MYCIVSHMYLMFILVFKNKKPLNEIWNEGKIVERVELNRIGKYRIDCMSVLWMGNLIMDGKSNNLVVLLRS